MRWMVTVILMNILRAIREINCTQHKRSVISLAISVHMQLRRHVDRRKRKFLQQMSKHIPQCLLTIKTRNEEFRGIDHLKFLANNYYAHLFLCLCDTNDLRIDNAYWSVSLYRRSGLGFTLAWATNSFPGTEIGPAAPLTTCPSGPTYTWVGTRSEDGRTTSNAIQWSGCALIRNSQEELARRLPFKFSDRRNEWEQWAWQQREILWVGIIAGE